MTTRRILQYQDGRFPCYRAQLGVQDYRGQLFQSYVNVAARQVRFFHCPSTSASRTIVTIDSLSASVRTEEIPTMPSRRAQIFGWLDGVTVYFAAAQSRSIAISARTAVTNTRSNVGRLRAAARLRQLDKSGGTSHNGWMWSHLLGIPGLAKTCQAVKEEQLMLGANHHLAIGHLYIGLGLLGVRNGKKITLCQRSLRHERRIGLAARPSLVV
jgi:hypothetical protein